MWWLAELMAELGYRSIPALGCRQALSLLKSSGTQIDLAIINIRLRGAGRLILILRYFGISKIVSIQDPGVHTLPVPGVLASIERPAGFAPVSRMEWRQKMQRLLLQIGSRAAS